MATGIKEIFDLDSVGEKVVIEPCVKQIKKSSSDRKNKSNWRIIECYPEGANGYMAKTELVTIQFY